MVTTVFTLYYKFIQCKFSYLHWHTSFTKSFLTIKACPPNTDNSFDILKNQFKRQGQQNKTSNNKKEKLSTKITPHLEEGNRQTEHESEKQCQFIYTAELCEEKDFENVSISHLSVQNKKARVQQKKESKLIKTKQSFVLTRVLTRMKIYILRNLKLFPKVMTQIIFITHN